MNRNQWRELFWIGSAIILLVGCETVIPISKDAYTPMLAVAVGITHRSGSVPTPEPIDECTSCGGQGWLGDGTIKRDCPDCETVWESAGSGDGDSSLPCDAPVVAAPVQSKGGDESTKPDKELPVDDTVGSSNKDATDSEAVPTKRVLYFRSGPRCPSCEKFKADYATNKGGLRDYIDKHYNLVQVRSPGGVPIPAFKIEGTTYRPGYGSAAIFSGWLKSQERAKR